MKAIVTTTIQPPTKAIEKFSKLKDWTLYIVGDLSTPHEIYESMDLKYLKPDYQEKKYKKLSDSIGWKSIQRRNIGFVEAYHDGAEIIATIDDDNIPYDDWGENLIVGKTQKITNYVNKNILFDPLSITNLDHWHRGYPPQFVDERNKNYSSEISTQIDIEVSLWDGIPDADAVSKMKLGNGPFNITGKFPYASEATIFSSQNAFLTKESIKEYAVLPHVGRMDDIWGCIVYQKRTNGIVAFTKPTVYHDRNKHDPAFDLIEEFDGYKNTLNLLNKGEKVLPDETKKFLDIYRESYA